MSLDTTSNQLFPEPTRPVGLKYIAALVFAQFVFFIALLGPAIIGIGLKVQSIVPDEEKASALGIVAGFGALVAVIANVVFGRISDRTTSRWGRRRPWIVSGTIGMGFALAAMAVAPNIPLLSVGWCFAQLAANAAFAPFIATISDQVPTSQRASVSAYLGIAQNIGILVATYVAELFATEMLIMFAMPSLFAVAGMLIFALVLPDRQLKTAPPQLGVREWLATFWIDPRVHTDYALAWLSRFLILLAAFMFTTFRLFFLQDRLGLSLEEAPAVVTRGVFVFTVTLILFGWVAGKISDRTGRRKMLVAGSTLFFAIGTALLVHIETVSGFYAVEALLGAAFGVYVAVDMALVVDVLPNPDDAGKDLGVFNIANALPQTVAPALGAFLLSIASAANQNYALLLYTAGFAGLIGALVILPIKKVK
ncbi:MAG: MFS transporter [Woeseiaceae bacterium]|nr:MFS transporter [Woeseiaceae bacterium]